MTGNSVVLDTNIIIEVFKGNRHIANTLKKLLKKGTPIPENDIWIAATALQHQLPLYTHDKHFKEVEDLQLAI